MTRANIESGDTDTDTGKRDSNSHHHLLAAKQGVADELASSQGNGSVVIRHGCGVVLLVSERVTKERLGGLASWLRSWEKGLAAKVKTGAAKIPKQQVVSLSLGPKP